MSAVPTGWTSEPASVGFVNPRTGVLYRGNLRLWWEAGKVKVAEVVDGLYCNHRTYGRLDIALGAEDARRATTEGRP